MSENASSSSSPSHTDSEPIKEGSSPYDSCGVYRKRIWVCLIGWTLFVLCYQAFNLESMSTSSSTERDPSSENSKSIAKSLNNLQEESPKERLSLSNELTNEMTSVSSSSSSSSETAEDHLTKKVEEKVIIETSTKDKKKQKKKDKNKQPTAGEKKDVTAGTDSGVTATDSVVDEPPTTPTGKIDIVTSEKSDLEATFEKQIDQAKTEQDNEIPSSESDASVTLDENSIVDQTTTKTTTTTRTTEDSEIETTGKNDNEADLQEESNIESNVEQPSLEDEIATPENSDNEADLQEESSVKQASTEEEEEIVVTSENSDTVDKSQNETSVEQTPTKEETKTLTITESNITESNITESNAGEAVGNLRKRKKKGKDLTTTNEQEEDTPMDSATTTSESDRADMSVKSVVEEATLEESQNATSGVRAATFQNQSTVNQPSTEEETNELTITTNSESAAPVVTIEDTGKKKKEKGKNQPATGDQQENTNVDTVTTSESNATNATLEVTDAVDQPTLTVNETLASENGAAVEALQNTTTIDQPSTTNEETKELTSTTTSDGDAAVTVEETGKKNKKKDKNQPTTKKENETLASKNGESAVTVQNTSRVDQNVTSVDRNATSVDEPTTDLQAKNLTIMGGLEKEVAAFKENTVVDVPKVEITTAATSFQQETRTNQEPPLACPTENRCSVLNLQSTFSFVHISECEGDSYIRELSKIFGKKDFEKHVYPTQERGAEHSVSWQRKKQKMQYTLTSMKSPRHHIWSLFTECKYGQNLYKKTKAAGFPRDHLDGTEEGDLMDFDKWLDHFVEPGKNENEYKLREETKSFNCYHPSNYQSRAFAVNNPGPMGVKSVNELEPDVEMVKSTYAELDAVPIAELFHESKCLLYYRLNMSEKKKVPKATSALLQEYLDTQCLCPMPETTSAALADVHLVHHDGGNRASMRHGVSSEIHGKIDALIRIDRPLYKLGFIQLLKEIVWLESNLGRKVLCSSRLQALDQELEYLWPLMKTKDKGSISVLYDNVRQESKKWTKIK